MKRNPSMTEEDWRWFELWKEARKFSAVEVELLEDRLRVDQSNIDIRIQLVAAHYNECEANNLKLENAEQKLAEQILWFIAFPQRLCGT
jgi:hypothetical protein